MFYKKHGNLAKKALESTINKNFKDTFRIVSEILESNGSSSMATVCGGSLALKAANIPVSDLVAGVAMGMEALDRHYTKSNIKKYRKTVTIVSSENDLIEVMKKIPTHLEFSSLPKIIGNERRVVISVAGYNQDEVNFAFKLFLDFCLENKKEYVLEDINDI